ncbi:hypothetical protein C5167_037731 [Papaver somniferum]|uniref:Uncharacterized protein n=1 Tax=Papaver somniferum TaxID=3469 RepID=A0A4Y7I771_PAPSO|nr:hypothetical protein C5167_037731 [Papaver somniferum]
MGKLVVVVKHITGFREFCWLPMVVLTEVLRLKYCCSPCILLRRKKMLLLLWIICIMLSFLEEFLLLIMLCIRKLKVRNRVGLHNQSGSKLRTPLRFWSIHVKCQLYLFGDYCLLVQLDSSNLHWHAMLRT